MSLLKVTTRRWRWAAGAFLLGLGDYLLFKLFGITMYVGEWDVTFGVVLFFATNFGGLGWVIGALLDQRDELEEQAEVIRDQYDELKATQRRAVENEKLVAVGRLAAGVAHEVRNPLGVIRTSADMLADELDAPDSRRAADYICQEVDQLNNFVGRLLDFTRPLKPEPAPVDLEELVDRVIRNVGEIDIETTVEEAGPVEVDAELVTRLLNGLVVNASDAVEADGRIAIRARRQVEATVFEVRDDGPGVPQEERDEIFEPFHTTKTDGTGLGLAMARKIAEVHGGRLTYVPDAGLGADGAGACFRFALPRNDR